MKKGVDTIIEEVVRRHVGSISKLPQKTDVTNRMVGSTGTVVVAAKYDSGVVMAADRQTTMGFKVFETTSKKIRKVSDFSGLGGAGTVGMIQAVTSMFRTIVQTFEVELEDENLPINNQRKLLQTFLRYLWFSYGDLWSEFIFAGFDKESEKTLVMEADDVSGTYLERPYGTIGSGWDNARQVLEDFFETRTPEGLSMQEASIISLRAVRKSGKKDAGCSDADLYLPMLVVIDKEGYREADEKTVKNLLEEARRPIS